MDWPMIVVLVTVVAWTMYQNRASDRSFLENIFGLTFPAGFKPSSKYRNLALDTNSKQLWAMDDRGIVFVLSKNEVLGSEVLTQPKFNSVTNASQQFYVRMLVRSTRVDAPLITVPFDAALTMAIGAGNRNYKQAVIWKARIDAFIRA